MSFQNLPWLYATLALIAMPVIIHLINRYRHRTVKWAAMMFLLDAKRMTSGMARLRQIMILALRTLAVAGLVFAVARPLASGWLGLAAGGAPDTVIVLLDRSASMAQQNPQTGESKRAAALAKLSEFLTKTKGATQLVLVESSENAAREVESVAALTALPETSATATAADIPAMLQSALDYVTDNQSGRTDIWICSDLRAGDWQANSGRWDALRAAFVERETVRFYLLSYDERAPENLAVSIDRVARRGLVDGAELTIDLRIKRDAAVENATQRERDVSVGFIVNGSRSVHELTLAEGQSEFLLQGYTIPIDERSRDGWGTVELPNDANPLDNAMHFVFSDAVVRKTTLVCEDPSAAKPLRAALGATADPAFRYQAEVVEPTPAGMASIDWEGSAMIIWQAPVPEAGSVVGRQLSDFVGEGKTLMFFPPEAAAIGEGGDAIFGQRWGDWSDAAEAGGVTISNWRRDSDLTADTQDGNALPMGELRLYRWREPVMNEATVLARSAAGGAPVFLRHSQSGPAASGGVYVCATLPQASHSNLARDGVALFVILHRALEKGAAALAGGNQRTCARGALPAGTSWTALAGVAADESAAISEVGLLPGIFSDGGEEPRLIAVNRPLEEDVEVTLGASDLEALFAGLEYERITLSVDDRRSLVSEIWRAFMIAMALALIIEAMLCLPAAKKPIATQANGRLPAS